MIDTRTETQTEKEKIGQKIKEEKRGKIEIPCTHKFNDGLGMMPAPGRAEIQKHLKPIVFFGFIVKYVLQFLFIYSLKIAVNVA